MLRRSNAPATAVNGRCLWLRGFESGFVGVTIEQKVTRQRGRVIGALRGDIGCLCGHEGR